MFYRVRSCFRHFGSVAELNRLCKAQKLEKALLAVDLLEDSGVSVSENIVFRLLRICSRKKDLTAAQRVRSLVVSNGLYSNDFWKDHLIRLFAACGALPEADVIFGEVLKPSLYTWNAILSAHAKFGEGKQALRLYRKMKDEGIEPNRITYLSILRACTSIKVLELGWIVHDHIVRSGAESNVVVGNTLIHMYAKCGSLQEAHSVFDNLLRRDVVSWGSMIAGYAQHGHCHSALELFSDMQWVEIEFDRAIFVSVLKACCGIGVIEHGRCVHGQIVRNGSGLEFDNMVGNALLDMYSKCGSLQEAQKVFDKLSSRDVVSWGTMIAGYVTHEDCLAALELFEGMWQEGIEAVEATYLCILRACGGIGATEQGRIIHELIIWNGLTSDRDIGNTLVDMYCKCGSPCEARKVFDMLKNRDVVSWNAMIAGYAVYGHDHLVIDLFKRMQEVGMKPSEVVVSFVLKACSNSGALNQGNLIHSQIIREELETDRVVWNTLLDMYTKVGDLWEARNVFDNLPHKDVVSWGAMISGYTQHGLYFQAVELFEKMQQEGLTPNSILFSSILKACGNLRALVKGKLIHECLIHSGLESDVVIGNTLVDMYAKCGVLDIARRVFEELAHRDDVSWTALIAGYTQHGYGFCALQLFEKMQQEGTKPSNVAFLCTLKACVSVGSLEQGRFAHNQVIENGLESDVVITNTIIDMYSKCGNLEDAGKLFDNLHNKNAVSWAAIITGYAAHGCFALAAQCLKNMRQLGMEPDEVMFTSVLSACSYSGLLEDGQQYFKLMQDEHDIAPSMEHYSCMVDLLAHAGKLNIARDLVQTIPGTPDVVVWRSLLASCRTFNNVEVAEYCFHHVHNLDPMDASGFMLMLNIYADAHQWEDVEKLQGMKIIAGVQKMAGKSWIEIGSKVHEFIVGGKGHPLSKLIFGMLKRLNREVKQEGYMPQLDIVLDPILPDCDENLSEKAVNAFEFPSSYDGMTPQSIINIQSCSFYQTVNKPLPCKIRKETIIKDAFWSQQLKNEVSSCKDVSV